MTLDEVIQTLREHKSELDERFAVKVIGVFGSYVRNEQTNESDIDIYVEFDMERISFDKYLDLIDYLEKLFHRNVDIITKAGVETIRIPYIKKEIKKETVYA